MHTTSVTDHHSKIDTNMEKKDNKNIIDMYNEDIDIFSTRSKPRQIKSDIKVKTTKSNTEVNLTKFDTKVKTKETKTLQDLQKGYGQRNPTFHAGHVSETMTSATRKALGNLIINDPDKVPSDIDISERDHVQHPQERDQRPFLDINLTQSRPSVNGKSDNLVSYNTNSDRSQRIDADGPSTRAESDSDIFGTSTGPDSE